MFEIGGVGRGDIRGGFERCFGFRFGVLNKEPSIGLTEGNAGKLSVGIGRECKGVSSISISIGLGRGEGGGS